MPELRIVPAQINTAQRLFASPLDYHIYPNKTAVPDELWQQPDLVIEQFYLKWKTACTIFVL